MASQEKIFLSLNVKAKFYLRIKFNKQEEQKFEPKHQDSNLEMTMSENEGSLLLLTCEEFEARYPEIAESAHEDSFKVPKHQKRWNNKKGS